MDWWKIAEIELPDYVKSEHFRGGGYGGEHTMCLWGASSSGRYIKSLTLFNSHPQGKIDYFQFPDEETKIQTD